MIYHTSMKPKQVVLDTNIIYASLRSKRGASFKLISLLGSGKFELNLSVPLVIEYEEVLERERKHLGLSRADVGNFLDYLCEVANLHEVYYLWRPHLKDPKDEMVLELAVRSESQYIVTYNKRDFQGVEAFGIEMVTAKEFLQAIGEVR